MRSLSLTLLVFASAASAVVSSNGKCGGQPKYCCIGYWEGECCSQYGFCGLRREYCGTGCRSAFGKCDGVALSRTSSPTSSPSVGFQTSTRTSSSAPSSSQPVSTDSRCGPSFGGRTCQGSRWGNCCSQYSYCESTIDYCEAKTCQKGYGTCNGASSSRSSSRSSTPSSTLPSSSSKPASSSFSSLPASSANTDTSTVISTPSATPTPTSTPSPTPTSSSTVPPGQTATQCTAVQSAYCAGLAAVDRGCTCGIGLDHISPYCFDEADCTSCISDADCPPIVFR